EAIRERSRCETAEVKTQVSTDRNSAVALLRQGAAVALPTETVYGLAADALNPIAVAKIFEAKGRPRFDPLIIHLPDPGWLEKVADPLKQDRQLVSSLAEKFWPGPFTMVLPKRDIIPEIVTAGLETVAVRISAHPIFSEIVSAFGKPLSAPSANRFGRISPTTAKHVLDELNGHIPLIIDAGPTTHGIESTTRSSRSRRQSVSLLARARRARCRSYRCRTSSWRGTRRCDFGSVAARVSRLGSNARQVWMKPLKSGCGLFGLL